MPWPHNRIICLTKTFVNSRNDRSGDYIKYRKIWSGLARRAHVCREILYSLNKSSYEFQINATCCYGVIRAICRVWDWSGCEVVMNLYFKRSVAVTFRATRKYAGLSTWACICPIGFWFFACPARNRDVVDLQNLNPSEYIGMSWIQLVIEQGVWRTKVVPFVGLPSCLQCPPLSNAHPNMATAAIAMALIWSVSCSWRRLWNALTTSSRFQPLLFGPVSANLCKRSICFSSAQTCRNWLSILASDRRCCHQPDCLPTFAFLCACELVFFVFVQEPSMAQQQLCKHQYRDAL